MIRRHFVSLLPLAASAAQSGKKKSEPPPPPPPGEQVRALFEQIVRGFITNAAKTSPSMAVVEFPGGLVTKGFLAKSGLSVTGVTRMMPALAAWIASGQDKSGELLTAVSKGLRNGCDPNNADYWQPANPEVYDQRQVEASIVAWSLWVLREQILGAASETERRNIAAWLESCTRHPVRKNNWAWFTAVNQAARLRLSEKWPEFAANEQSMIEDLQALDAMAAGDSGWYNDGFEGEAFDYYNSWVFASHFLYWNELVGGRYPEWQKRFAARLARYLDNTPFFFASNGAHVLYGRSLIYRWGVLTPLVLAYRQKMWPHSAGLLQRMVQQNILWQAQMGAFDAAAGKLRPTFTPEGSSSITESYIDGGHPYWGMQAFDFWRIPAGDPFWTVKPEPLPVEQSDFSIALSEPGLLLAGARASGQVRVFNAKSTRTDPQYRDEYNKFAYLSHFPFSANHQPGHATLDNALVLRDTRSGETAGRGPVKSSTVEAEKFEIEYTLALGAVKANVTTKIHWMGDFEARQHYVTVEGGPLEGIELCDGGVAYSPTRVYPEANIRTWGIKGWKSNITESALGSVFYDACNIQVLRTPAQAQMYLTSLRYQSPKAFPQEKIDAEAKAMVRRLAL
jgi:hypothetical protein